MFYKNWLLTWLNDYVRPVKKFRTYARYQSIVRLYLLPNLGNEQIEKLNHSQIQSFVSSLGENSLTHKPLSASTINSIISVIQLSLKSAMTARIVKYNVAHDIVRPKVMQSKVLCFTLAEQQKIENYCTTHKKHKLLGIILSLYTGLRIGELLALTKNDVDVKNGFLSVNHTCYDTPEGRVLDTPKTIASCRIIPLPQAVLNIVKKMIKVSDNEFLITDNGKPISVRSYQRTFELILKKLDIPHKGFHALRHTFATRALECGMDVKTLSELLGHRNPIITLNRYVHSLLEHKKAMMNRLYKSLNKKFTD